MADWAADVKKYAPNADDAVIAKVVRHCGIALQKADSSWSRSPTQPNSHVSRRAS
jgi:hypothetical protein